MNPFAGIFTICCLALAHGRPGFSHSGNTPLEGVPNESHYGKLTYPHFDVLELGSTIKDHLPPAVVTINKKVIIKEPKPYPVKVPVPVPHPIEVPKPYPIVHTKIVKVPHPVPVEIVKKIPVPIEVPKAFPSHESFGGSFGGQEQFGHQQFEASGNAGGGGGYGDGFEGAEQAGGYADADQSNSFGVKTQWVPVDMIQNNAESQQIEEHQQ